MKLRLWLKALNSQLAPPSTPQSRMRAGTVDYVSDKKVDLLGPDSLSWTPHIYPNSYPTKMTCHRSTKPRSTGTASADILTYRYNGKLVYVPVAPDYTVSPTLHNILPANDQPRGLQQALSHARDAFSQLKGRCDSSLSLSMTMTTAGPTQKFVAISPLAWPKLISRMSCYQIIDVDVTQAHERDTVVPVPDIVITYADGDDSEPAPPYCTSNDVDNEKASYSRPPSPSTPALQRKRSWFFQKFVQ
ncbi:hypothetical protein HD554DRAFT_2295277 [Boletus coccyginus]|nr:hypothetical protein HD554DRAFT_2295277 [Boletus coccyginus]